MSGESITVKQARRLALVSGGLLQPRLIGMPSRAAGAGQRARNGGYAVVTHFGYLQIDSVAVSGARTHSIVLGSRLAGMRSIVGENLLQVGGGLFEYWGHEASWLPLSLYPAFEFRRQAFKVHPWYGDVLGNHPQLADELLLRLRDEGPLRSLDLAGETRGSGWGTQKLAQRVLHALWSTGEVAIRNRRNFQRLFDLTERVIPAGVRAAPLPLDQALDILLLKALNGHGWATTGTLAATWRLRNMGAQIKAALGRLNEQGQVMSCMVSTGTRVVAGWSTPRMLGLLPRLDRLRPRSDTGVLLSPFDPILWDRARTRLLFDFNQRLEIYKPPTAREYGYYCLPLLAGDALLGRVDLKADRKRGVLRVVAMRYEDDKAGARLAMETALRRFADFVSLELAR